MVGCLCSLVDGVKVLGPETNRTEVIRYLKFDWIEIWKGIFSMQKFMLDTLINDRTRTMMLKDDLNIAWSILHRRYTPLSTVKQWLTFVDDAFTHLPSSLLEMTRSLNRVNTARLSHSMNFTLPSFDQINDENWLQVKDMTTQALTSQGLASLLSTTKPDGTFKLLDKLAGSDLRFSLRDSNVSRISYNEDRFSTMFSSL